MKLSYIIGAISILLLVSILTILALLPLAFSNEDREEPIRVVKMNSIQGNMEAADFILQCAKNASSMSGEDPEDMLEGCRNIAGEIHGEDVYHVYSFEHGNHCYSDSVEESRKCAKDKLKGDNNG